MKKILCALLALVMLLAFAGCSKKTKLLHCDRCQKEVYVEEDSKMEEDWILYCDECYDEAFGGEPLVEPVE